MTTNIVHQNLLDYKLITNTQKLLKKAKRKKILEKERKSTNLTTFIPLLDRKARKLRARKKEKLTAATASSLILRADHGHHVSNIVIGHGTVKQRYFIHHADQRHASGPRTRAHGWFRRRRRWTCRWHKENDRR